MSKTTDYLVDQIKLQGEIIKQLQQSLSAERKYAAEQLRLGQQAAWEHGWRDHFAQHEEQRKDPNYLIILTNPYGGR